MDVAATAVRPACFVALSLKKLSLPLETRLLVDGLAANVAADAELAANVKVRSAAIAAARRTVRMSVLLEVHAWAWNELPVSDCRGSPPRPTGGERGDASDGASGRRSVTGWGGVAPPRRCSQCFKSELLCRSGAGDRLGAREVERPGHVAGRRAFGRAADVSLVRGFVSSERAGRVGAARSVVERQYRRSVAFI